MGRYLGISLHVSALISPTWLASIQLIYIYNANHFLLSLCAYICMICCSHLFAWLLGCHLLSDVSVLLGLSYAFGHALLSRFPTLLSHVLLFDSYYIVSRHIFIHALIVYIYI